MNESSDDQGGHADAPASPAQAGDGGAGPPSATPPPSTGGPRGLLPLSPRARRWAAGVAAFLLVGTAVAAGGSAAGWWAGEEPAANTAAVREAFARAGVALPVDPGLLRTVARFDGGELVAAPESGGGYCLAPSLDTEAYVGMVCDDRPASTLAAGATSTFVSWAITTGGRPTWVLVGRIGDPGAAAVSVFDLRIDLATNGFFAGAVPTEAWDRLSTATGTLTVLDSDGLTVRTSCVTLGPSPKAIPADSTAVVPSEIDARVSCDEEKPAASSDVFPAETDGTETTRQP